MIARLRSRHSVRRSGSALIASALVATTFLTVGLASPQRAGKPSWQRWEAQLEALRPSEALAYFELAEVVHDLAESEDDRALARHLFSLAGALDSDRLGRSAALALADLAEQPQSRRRLQALAGLLGGDDLLHRPFSPDPAISAMTNDDAAIALSEAFSYYRAGRGPQALKALEQAGAMELLRQSDAHVPGGAKRFIEDCKHYRGQLQPILSETDIERMLRLEATLLRGDERPWYGELRYGGGEPLIEVDPARLPQAFGVDASLAHFRDGVWLESAPPG